MNTTWTNAQHDNDFGAAANWSNGVPGNADTGIIAINATLQNVPPDFAGTLHATSNATVGLDDTGLDLGIRLIADAGSKFTHAQLQIGNPYCQIVGTPNIPHAAGTTVQFTYDSSLFTPDAVLLDDQVGDTATANVVISSPGHASFVIPVNILIDPLKSWDVEAKDTMNTFFAYFDTITVTNAAIGLLLKRRRALAQ